jgi:hypothetical protein
MTQQADFSAALNEALLSITATLQCNYTISAPPEGEAIDLDAVNVVYSSSTGEDFLIARNGAESCDLGWYLSEDTNEVLVCGSTCDALREDPTGSVEVLLGCVTLVPPVW